MDSKKYVFEVAFLLNHLKLTLPVKDLTDTMNSLGYKTTRNLPYKGLRGSYKLIHATYNWLVSQNRQLDANKVAKAFTKPDGSYAY